MDFDYLSIPDRLPVTIFKNQIFSGAPSLTANQIKAALPLPRKRSAVVYAREICLIEAGPITLKAMEMKMRKAGYVTRSQNFASYLRRVLRGSPAFVEVSSGMWALRATAADAA